MTLYRRANLYRHKIIGYVYALAVVIGTCGAIALIVHSASGIASTVAFIYLISMWPTFFFYALNHAIQKRIEDHKRWMIRHYALTWAAVPFRVFPLLIHSFGVDVQIAYATGAWTSVLFVQVIAEVYLMKMDANSIKISASSIDMIGSQPKDSISISTGGDVASSHTSDKTRIHLATVVI